MHTTRVGSSGVGRTLLALVMSVLLGVATAGFKPPSHPGLPAAVKALLGARVERALKRADSFQKRMPVRRRLQDGAGADQALFAADGTPQRCPPPPQYAEGGAAGSSEQYTVDIAMGMPTRKLMQREADLMYECDRCNTTQSSVLMCSGTQVNMTFYNGSACNPQNVSYSTNVSSSYDVGVCINLTALWAIPDFYYDDGSKPEPFYSDNGSKPEPFVDPMPTRKLLQNYSLAADGSASSSIVYDNDRRAQPGSQMWVCDNGMLRQISYSDELCQTPLPDNTYTHVCSTDCLDFPYDWDFDGRDGDDAWTTVVDAATGAGGNYSGGYAGDGYASDYPDEYETCPDDGEDGILVRMCVADADGTLMPVEAVFDNERACVPANYTAARFWQPLNSTCAPAMLLNMTLPMRAQSVKLYDCNNTQTRFPVTYFYNSTNCTGQAVAREAAPYTRCDKCCKDCPKERPPSGGYLASMPPPVGADDAEPG